MCKAPQDVSWSSFLESKEKTNHSSKAIMKQQWQGQCEETSSWQSPQKAVIFFDRFGRKGNGEQQRDR